MPVPKFWDLMVPLLRIAAEGEVHIAEARDRLAKDLALSDEDVSELLPSGNQTYLVNRTSWARIYLEKAGLLKTTGKARFVITDAGRALLADNPSGITNDVLQQYPSYVEWKHASKSRGKPGTATAEGGDDEANPEEQMEESYALLNEALATELIDKLLGLTPEGFEKAIVELLLGMGYGSGRKEMDCPISLRPLP